MWSSPIWCIAHSHGSSRLSGWLGFGPITFSLLHMRTLNKVYLRMSCIYIAVLKNGCPSLSNFTDNWQLSVRIFSHFSLLDGHSITATKPCGSMQLANTFLPDCYMLTQNLKSICWNHRPRSPDPIQLFPFAIHYIVTIICHVLGYTCISCIK